jgi:UDP-glucose 4-epimerase
VAAHLDAPRGRWVVTGGAGFIGSHLCAALAPTADVVVVDDLSRGKASRLPAHVDLRRASILDAQALDDAMRGADVVVHLAALTSVVECEGDPARCDLVNAEGSRLVLEAARKANVRRLVFASTCAVYGNGSPPLSETATVAPVSAYARSKLAAERFLLKPAPGATSTVALRFFNVYGPGQDPNSPYAAAVPIFLTRALAGQPLVLHGGGAQTRDFVFVADVVQAILRAARLPGAGGVFNVGSGHPTSIRTLAGSAIQLAASRAVPEDGPARAADVRDSWADTAAARDRLGFQATTTLQDGLARTLAALREQRSRAPNG